MLNSLRGAIIIDALILDYEAADPNDGWLLRLADAGRADVLVAGDKRSGLLARGRVARAGIQTAAQFCNDLD